MGDQHQQYDKSDAATELPLREYFRQANASLSLDAMVINDDALAIQERIIRREISFDQAAALYLALARKSVLKPS